MLESSGCTSSGRLPSKPRLKSFASESGKSLGLASESSCSMVVVSGLLEALNSEVVLLEVSGAEERAVVEETELLEMKGSSSAFLSISYDT